MIDRHEVAIVGGGPAGSSCAWALRRAGVDAVVLDAATFPRQKVCAGWLTPRVFQSLELDPREYRDTGRVLQEVRAFGTGIIGDRRLVDTNYDRVVSYAIRRVEFDDFLLRRARAPVLQNTRVTDIRRDDTGAWILNERVAARILVGAGGHFCPVARKVNPPARERDVVVARELEAPLDGATCMADGQRPELFFCRDLEGYGWCVKKHGFVNIGFGRRGSRDFQTHVAAFADWLRARGTVPTTLLDWRRWRGHAYRLRRPGRRIVDDGVVLVGDAAGLAWPESGEGIAPAIESGIAAARTIVEAGVPADAGAWRAFGASWGVTAAGDSDTSGISLPATLARGLLRVPFVTRFALDRWFLRTAS